MIQVTTKVTTTITLELDEFAAAWLKGVVQNPMWSALDEEPPQDREMRKAFWDALNPTPPLAKGDIL